MKWILACLVLMAAILPRGASAQYIEPKTYCYSSSCFETLAAAEANMRSRVQNGQLYNLDRTWVADPQSANPTEYFYYKIADQPPEVLYAPAYAIAGADLTTGGWCTPSTNPHYPTYCADEADGIQGFYNARRAGLAPAGCVVTYPEVLGEYASPIAGVVTEYPYTIGKIGFRVPANERKIRWTVWCPGWGTPNPDVHTGTILKQQTFTCPAGFSPKIASEPEAKWPLVCAGSSTEPYISGRVKQVKTCPATKNPCHPATGDKSRREHDFDFAGRPFERHYHSLRQYVDPTLAPGWSHSYGDRLDGVKSLFNADGTFEGLAQISTTRYRPQNSPDRVLDVLSGTSPKYRLSESSGEFREFDSNGRLLRVRDPSRPMGDVDLVYSGTFLTKVVSVNDGRELRFEYAAGVLARIRLPDGSAVSYDYDVDGNLISVDYGSGVRYYHYHEDGLAGPEFRHHLTGITSEDGRRYASFGYDNFGRVVSSRLVSEAGFVESTTLNYVSANQVVVTTDGAGVQTVDIQPGVYRRPLLITDSSGVKARTYRADGRTASATDQSGARTEYEYADSYVSAKVEAVGTPSERRSTFQRDSANRVIRREVSSKRSGSQVVERIDLTTYDSLGRSVASCSVDPSVAGAQGYVCGSTSNAPVGVRQTVSRYCEAADVAAGTCPVAGLRMSVDGPRIDVLDATAYQYYPADHSDCATSPASCAWRKGDLWKVTNALGQVAETLRYDGAGRMLSVKDANDIVTDFEYHPRGWLTARKVRGADDSSEADDQIIRIAYYPTGLASSTTLPDGSFTSYVYDAAHRLTDVVDADGNSIHYTLDNAGNRTKEEVKDSNGSLKRTLSRVYDQLGQLQTAKDAGNHPTGFTYDANGNLDTTTDALGREADNDYDPLNRLSRTLQDVGGIAASTGFKYDAQDNLTEVVDPKGLSTKYQYNAFGDLTHLESPDTGVTTYGYDAAGNRTSALDARGEPSSYAYDALNRLTGITYSDAALNVTYTYDAVQPVCDANESFATGRLTRMDDGSGSTQYCHDRFGNLTRKVQVTNGQSFTLRYAYTKAGQLAAMQYPDGMTVDYVRDGLGHATEIGVTLSGGTRQVLLTGATYHPFGPVAGWTFGNSRTMSRTLDLDYRPRTILSTGTGAGGLNLGFGWDAVGNMASLHTSGLEQPPRITFGYDALNRLTAFQDGPTGAAIEQYTYDATGNRTSFTNAGGTQPYTYPADGHRLTAVGATARTYDAMGNTTSIGGTEREFAYNAAGRMSQVQRDNVVAMEYAYNGKGEQVRKHLGTGGTHAMYDESGHWLGAYENDGAPTQQAVWLDDLPVGLIADGLVHYIETDHLGTPRAVIEPQRDVAVWTWDIASEAFGNSAPNQDSDSDSIPFVLDMRFPGQRFDAASSLNQNGYRDYEASSGRYSQSDPVGLGGGLATYSYVEASPLGSYDPYGLAVTTVDACIARHGPARCGVATQPNRRLAPGALGGGLTASIWCMATGCIVPGSRPGDMTPLEERHFDRHCNGKDDPCRELKAATKQAITMARLKMNNMLSDGGRLYGGQGWVTHAADLAGRIAGINAMISLGEKMGCDMSEERALASGLTVPGAPR